MNLAGLYLENYKHSTTATAAYNRGLFAQLSTAITDEERGEIEQEIILSNLRTIHFVLSKFNNIKHKLGVFRITYDDLFSAGYYGLWKAVKSFDHTRNIQFMTYSTTIIRNEMLMILRRFKKVEFNLSLGEIVSQRESSRDSGSLTIEDLLPDDRSQDEFERVFSEDLANRILVELEHSISSRDFTIYTIHLEGDVSQRDLSELFGITQPYVSRIIRKCEKRVKMLGEKMLDGGKIICESM